MLLVSVEGYLRVVLFERLSGVFFGSIRFVLRSSFYFRMLRLLETIYSQESVRMRLFTSRVSAVLSLESIPSMLNGESDKD